MQLLECHWQTEVEFAVPNAFVVRRSISGIIEHAQNRPKLLTIRATKSLSYFKLLIGWKFLQNPSGMSKRIELLRFRSSNNLILEDNLDYGERLHYKTTKFNIKAENISSVLALFWFKS